MLSIPVEALLIVELILYTANHLFDSLSPERRIHPDKSCIIIVPRHTAVRDIRTSLAACLVEQKQEGDIMRKNDNLPVLPFLGKSPSHDVAVHMIKRRNRVIENDG